jgi:hypothetical protein
MQVRGTANFNSLPSGSLDSAEGMRPFDPVRDPHLDWGQNADHDRWGALGMTSCLYYWREDYWLTAENHPP